MKEKFGNLEYFDILRQYIQGLPAATSRDKEKPPRAVAVRFGICGIVKRLSHQGNR